MFSRANRLPFFCFLKCISEVVLQFFCAMMMGMMWLFISCNPSALFSSSSFSHIEPMWGLSDIQPALDEILSHGLPNSSDFWDVYRVLYDEGATPSCPGTEYNFDGNELTSYECYTPDGFQFEGLSEFMYELGGWRLHLGGKILAPDGRIVHGAGSVSIEEDDFIRKGFEGTLYSNFGAEWLENKPSLLLYLERFDQRYELDGGYTIAGRSILFRHFQFEDCPYGEGELLIREPKGGWWRYEAPHSCSETGRVYFEDVHVGSLKLDFSILRQELERVLP